RPTVFAGRHVRGRCHFDFPIRLFSFFCNDAPATDIYTLSLHDALPISFISGRLATKSNQIKQLIRNGRSASLQRTFKKSFTSFSHSTRNKTRDGLNRVRNIRALNGRFNTSITHAYSIVIGSKHIRSEERFSRNAETDLVCRLLLEKKKTHCSLSP